MATLRLANSNTPAFYSAEREGDVVFCAAKGDESQRILFGNTSNAAPVLTLEGATATVAGTLNSIETRSPYVYSSVINIGMEDPRVTEFQSTKQALTDDAQALLEALRARVLGLEIGLPASTVKWSGFTDTSFAIPAGLESDMSLSTVDGNLKIDFITNAEMAPSIPYNMLSGVTAFFNIADIQGVFQPIHLFFGELLSNIYMSLGFNNFDGAVRFYANCVAFDVNESSSTYEPGMHVFVVRPVPGDDTQMSVHVFRNGVKIATGTGPNSLFSSATSARIRLNNTTEGASATFKEIGLAPVALRDDQALQLSRMAIV